MWIQVGTPFGWSEPQDVALPIAIAMVNGGTARAIKVDEQRQYAAQPQATEVAMKSSTSPVTKVVQTAKKAGKEFASWLEQLKEEFGVVKD